MILLNRRRIMVDSGRPPLPYDAEIKYIEATGTQYISTGILFAVGLKVQIEAIYTDRLTTTQILVGIGGTGGYWFGNVNNNSGAFGVGANNNQVVGPSNVRTELTFTYLSGTTTVSANGKTGSISRGTNPTGYTINLFCGNNNYYSSARIYSCKIADSNDVLLRDFIPVRVGSTGYLYDKVSGELFGNSGTGDLVLGHDIGISYDAQLEYIGSTGTQWIDTGISPTTNTEVYIKARYNSFTTSGTMCGARTGTTNNNRFFVFAHSSEGVARCTYGSTQYTQNIVYGSTIYTIKFNETSTHKCYFNGTNLGTLSGYTKGDSQQLLLFGTTGYNANHYLGVGSIYECTIKENGVTVRDFIPVRVGAIGYLYDSISGELFENQGTGSFTLGPDKT